MASEITKRNEVIKDSEERVITPPSDIYETENEFVIKADMPGVKKEKINITIDNNILDISAKIDDEIKKKEGLRYAEYNILNYDRSFNVGDNIDVNRITADVEKGVLTLTLPKKEEVKPKKIEITIG